MEFQCFATKTLKHKIPQKQLAVGNWQLAKLPTANCQLPISFVGFCVLVI